jgi:hypothetical protein
MELKTFEQIRAHVIKHGGLTLSLRDGQIPEHKTGYYVSLKNGLIIQSIALSVTVIHDFIIDHLWILNLSGFFLGIWYDKKTSLVYIDVTKWIREKSRALSFGYDNNQKAIYDVKHGKVIPI